MNGNGDSTPADDPPATSTGRLGAGLDLDRVFLVVAVAFCSLKLFFLCVYTFRAQYIVDEFWQASDAFRLADFYRTYYPPKTVLYAYFYSVARMLTSTSNGMMTAGRVQTMLLVLLLLAIAWRTWRRIGLSRNEALFALCVTLSFSNFLEHSFSLRSDSVALFFDVAAVAIACSGEVSSRRRMFLAGATMGLAFLCTQKAIYAGVALGVAVVVVVYLSSGFRRTVAVGAACAGGFFVSLGAYVLAFSRRDVLGVLRMGVKGPADLVLHGSQFYPDLRKYIGQALDLNPVAYALCAAGIVLAVREWRTALPPRRFALVFAIAFTTLVFAHNAPWPYVLAAPATFLAPWAAESVSRIGRIVRDGRLGAILVLLLLSTTFSRNVHHLQKSNDLQREVTAQAERLLGPLDTYMDGTGMIARRRLADNAWWDLMRIMRLREAASRRDFRAIRLVFAAQPKVWVWNWRIALMAPVIGPALAESYVAVTPNVLLAGTPIQAQPRRFFVPWSGAYSIYGASGEVAAAPVVVDGLIRATPVPLSMGFHVVSTPSGGAPQYLLPSRLPLTSVAEVRSRPADLYPRPYD